MCCVIKYQDFNTSALIEEFFKLSLSAEEFISKYREMKCQIIVGDNLNYTYYDSQTNCCYKLQKNEAYIFTSTKSKFDFACYMLKPWLKEYLDNANFLIDDLLEVLINICCSHTIKNNDDEFFVDKGSYGTCYSLAAVITNYQKIDAKERILTKYSSLQQKWILREFKKIFYNNYNEFCGFKPDEKVYPEISEDILKIKDVQDFLKKKEILIKNIYGVNNKKERKCKDKLVFKIKKPVTAYNYFVREKRNEFANLLKNKMEGNEISKYIGRYWKILTHEERKKYCIKSYYDEIRCYNEFINAIKEGKDVGNIIIKEPKNYHLFIKANSDYEKYKVAEKSIKKIRNFVATKARTPYILFMKEQSQLLKSKYPHIKFTDVSYIVSEDWNNIKMSEKEKYFKMSEKERIAYKAKKEELANYYN